MDITNARSMELFRRLALVDALRSVAVPEDNNFDVSWVTSLTGHELHRFRYKSVNEWRRLIRENNDGSMPGCLRTMLLTAAATGALCASAAATPSSTVLGEASLLENVAVVCNARGRCWETDDA
jgi:hypothetical protein